MKGTVYKHGMNGKRPLWEWAFYAGPKDPSTGKRPRKTKGGFTTKAEAEAALGEAIAAHLKPPTPREERAMPTFAEFYRRWHTEVIQRMHGTKTYENSDQHAQYALRLFGETPLDQLTPEQLTTDFNWLEDQGGKKTASCPDGRPLSSTTVRHVEFLVQGCLQQACDWDIIAKNPMRKVRKHRRARKTGDAPVADKHGLERLLKVVAGTSLFAPVMVDAATGIRRGELCGLTWLELDEDKSVLSVSKSLSETKEFGLKIKSTKGGKPRRFHIDADVLEVLRDHRREQNERRTLFGDAYRNDLNLIFCPDGNFYSPKKLSTRITYAMRKAGLGNLSLHSLRHSHASQLLSDGVPVAAVSERLGHANPGITLAIYTHAMPADNQAAALVWNTAMKTVIEASRRENFARKRRVTADNSRKSGKIVVMPLESAS
jgi:integrase